MFWFSNEISCFTLPKFSHSEYFSPSAVFPNCPCVDCPCICPCAFAIVCALVHIGPPMVNQHHAISSWPSGDPPLASLPSCDLPSTDPRSTHTWPNLSFIHSRWASHCTRGSSDSSSADYSRRALLHSKRILLMEIIYYRLRLNKSMISIVYTINCCKLS